MIGRKLTGMAAALLAATAWTAPVLADAAPQMDRLVLHGLTAPAKVTVDRWGIAHIRAGNVHDAFFVQGWNAARDRLWQIDLWRKRGLGRLSASFGPAYLAQDRASRLLLYRGDMAAEWASYPAGAKAETEAFVAGINAYIAQSTTLPPEFTITRTRPELWAADDVVRIRSHALVSNVADEVERARLLCQGGAPFLTLHRRIEPAHDIRVPTGLDPCSIPADVLDDYLLGTKGVSFAAPALSAAGLPDAVFADSRDRAASQEGSNNWAIDAAHSATGRPIVANDPHRAHGVPALRYLVDLAAPGLHIAGAGEPSLPGISFGHNDTIAWGLTIFPADQEDLYVYDISPQHPGAYLYQGQWEPFQTEQEAVPVRGGTPEALTVQNVTLAYTRHGPVIHQDGTHAYALRTVWTEPGGAGYFNASWLYGATGWGDFTTAQAHWSAPPLNLVYADVHGDIGWRPAAFIPQRSGWDGLLPVPGDGRFEWRGMIAASDLPVIHNPSRGFVATANAINLPKDWPSETRPVSFVWSDPSRIDEIEARLAAKPKLTLDDMTALQTDTTSRLALRGVALLRGLTTDDADAQKAIVLLQGWDGDERADSGAAALAELWLTSQLAPVAATTVAKGDLAKALENAAPGAVIDWLARGDARLGPDPALARRTIVVTSLAAAWRDAVARLGADPAHWRWGDLHLAQWSPAIAPRVPATMLAKMTVGPLGVGGSGSTPMATWDARNAYTVTGGASVRLVMDVGAWDNSRVINSPGQSGDPFSAHYRDLFPLWAAGRYVPFVYSDAAVAAAAERVISLDPAR
ncbi:penicillin acylase family protein [Novosphingobium sp.]|uniref:penicillin acylase family protein n=1 Tax=Novosphingobium sp. TaxID=1874826 RepID=UPI0033429BA9